MKHQESIGERLRRLRRERGLSQRDIAGKGVSFTYVSRIEGGQREPSVKALRLLAPKLGVSAEYLETGHEAGARTDIELRLADAELQLRLDDAGAAERRLQEIAREAEDAGDDELARRASVALALAAARLGRPEDTVTGLERFLDDTNLSVGERPDVYASLARAYAAAGETPRAVALLQRCVDEVSAAEQPDPILFVRFASYLSYALMDVGDSAGAHDVLARALRQVDGAADRTTLIRLYWSLGRYYALEGPPARALDYVRRAIALLEATEDTFYLARAHELCGTILLDQASAEQAGEHLDIAERLFADLDEEAALGSVCTELARRAFQLGDPETARTQALRALDLLGDSPPADVGRAWRALAEVFDGLGDDDLADRSYRIALERLVEQGAGKLLAETYRSYGKFLRARGREGEALDAYERAADLATHASVAPRPSLLRSDLPA